MYWYGCRQGRPKLKPGKQTQTVRLQFSIFVSTLDTKIKPETAGMSVPPSCLLEPVSSHIVCLRLKFNEFNFSDQLCKKVFPSLGNQPLDVSRLPFVVI